MALKQSTSDGQASFPYLDTKLDLNERVRDLVSRFTLEEKIESMMQYQPAIERLGVNAYKHGTEAAHGMAWLGEATSFPQPIGLGCTWNPTLMREIGSAIGDEARVFYQRNPEVNGLTLWAPTIDMERDPRWGRTEEAYGEDPFLTGELTAGLVQGMQGDHPVYYKSIATLKHFIGNNNEINRGKCSASIDPRNMKEYYQAAFKPAFVKGGAKSMMTSYNAVNGVPTILHEDVDKVVKQEWGMDGFIVSDAGDLLGIVRDHHYYETDKEAVSHAIKAGIDSMTDEKDKTCAALREALSEGLLAESDLDKALRNTFRVRFMLGEFDPEEGNPYAPTPESKLCAPEHAVLSLQAAKESIVLLKNEGGILPLSRDTCSDIALIGPLADTVYRDWYSGTLPYKVTPLQGLRNKLAGPRQVKLRYSSGHDVIRLATASGSELVIDNDNGSRLSGGVAGQAGECFELTDWGHGSLTLRSKSTGKLLTSSDDKHLAATADEAFGWFVKEALKLEEAANGLLSLQTWDGKQVLAPSIDSHHAWTIEDDAASPASHPDSGLKKIVERDGIAEAAAAARAAETAIVVVGNNPLINGKEEIDRPSLELPESQQRLIRAVLAENPRTIVVIIGSYPYALGNLIDEIPAIIYLAHAGQELGNALAEVLIGDYSPAGRLNMTWYKSESQLTSIMDYDIMKSGRTYQYAAEEPLFPFGHGLSYSQFQYSAMQIERSSAPDGSTNGDLAISFLLKNNAGQAAEEVAQAYVRVEGSSVRRPLKKLIGFQRVRLEAWELKRMTIRVSEEELRFWDVTRGKFCLESADYRFMIGASSSDIRLSQSLELHGEVVPPRDLSRMTQADCYDDYEGIFLDDCKEGGTCARAIGSEGRLSYRRNDWPRGAKRFSGRIRAIGAGELILQSVGSDGCGRVELGVIRMASGTEAGWVDASIELSQSVQQGSSLDIVLKGGLGLSRFSIQ